MSGAEWNGAIALLRAWLVHQPAPIPVVVMLAVGFSLVMFIEGFRVNFLPARLARSKIVRTQTHQTVGIETSNSLRSSAAQAVTMGSSLRATSRFVPKQHTALRRVYGAPRPAVCHRIKLEMVNLEPVEQPLPLADQD